MKYRNRHTGAIVGPSCEVAAQSFAQSADWEEVKPFSHPLVPPTPNLPVSKPLLQMNKTELLAVAAEKGLDLPSSLTKAEIIERIKLADKGGDPDGADPGNE